MEFLDTNVFLRYIVQPDPGEVHLVRQAGRARAIFQGMAQGGRTATTCEGVIVEIVQVLSSRALYNVPRADIQRLLSPLLRLPALKLAHKRAYFRALDLYVEQPRLDFVDCLNVAHMERQGIGRILSFDRDFDRVAGIERHEGGADEGQ